jgi:hypothetical protein
MAPLTLSPIIMQEVPLQGKASKAQRMHPSSTVADISALRSIIT